MLEALGIASMVFVALFTWRAYRKPTGAGQSPREAILEAWLSLALGFALNPLVLPLMTHGGQVTAAGNWWGSWIFTAVSLARQYAVRRWAGANIHRLAAWIARLIP